MSERTIYIACAWGRREQAEALSVVLEREGYNVSHKWWEQKERPRADTRYYDECARSDIRALGRSDVVVLLDGMDCRGALVEVGFGIGRNLPIYFLLWGPDVRPYGSNIFLSAYGTECTCVDHLLENLNEYFAK